MNKKKYTKNERCNIDLLLRNYAEKLVNKSVSQIIY